MAIYRLGNEVQRLEQMEKTTFGAENIYERDDLQALLKQQIEVIAPDCLVISEEFSFSDRIDSKRRIDLLAVNKTGDLVVIELKRGTTGDHMELQALRYASMMSTLTFSEAVEIFSAFLTKERNADVSMEAAKQELLIFLGEDFSEEDFAADVRIILMSSDFSKELTTSVMWLNQRDLSITCIRMIPYKDEKGLLIEVRQIIPLPEAADYLVKVKKKNNEQRKIKERSREFEAVITQFISDYPDMELKGSSITYRQVRFQEWPTQLHYEFIHIRRSNSVGLELHLESQKVSHLARLLESYHGTKLEEYPIEWDPTWSAGKGRIKIVVPFAKGEAFISKMMHDLVELTREKVDAALLGYWNAG